MLVDGNRVEVQAGDGGKFNAMELVSVAIEDFQAFEGDAECSNGIEHADTRYLELIARVNIWRKRMPDTRVSRIGRRTVVMPGHCLVCRCTVVRAQQARSMHHADH